jgi:hypothetical protein
MKKKTESIFKLIKRIFVFIGFISILIGIIVGILAIIQYYESHPTINLNGEWKIINSVDSTSYPLYQDMQLGYRIFLQQDGKKITGKGEKWWENGKEIPSTAHSPIVIEGTLDGMMLTATFTEKGARRITSGSFIWTVSPDGRMLNGSFKSTAANSQGASIGEKIE